MKTLTLFSRTTVLAVALVGCGTDAITLGELIEAVDDGDAASSSDDSLTPSEPAPSEEPSSPESPSEEPTPEPAPSEPEASEPTPPEAEPSGDDAEAVRILRQYCGECHTGVAAQGDLGNIDDIDAMIAIGRIIPGDKEDSPIYARMLGQTMPPAFYAEQPSATEILFIGEFIDRLAE
jgi:hypothetical protein